MSPSSANTRIAKNTAFLYVRMLVVMCVTLFTSRVILNALGAVDYGIYNVVGGLSVSFIFFSSSLSNSTQRFLTYELGRGTENAVKRVFSFSLLLYSLIALAVIIVGLTVGGWYVSHRLVVPPAQIGAAKVVLFTSIITLAFSFVFSVFESVLIARENMKIYAYLGLIDAIAKLLLAYLLLIVDNRLVFYAWAMLVVQLTPRAIMALYCCRKYPEASLRFVWNNALFREMFGFTGWNLYGSVAWMVNEQGIDLLLNLFFGPIVNAARGIASQVNNAVNNFATNFFMAVRPQIIKRFASQEMQSLLTLIFTGSKISVYLLWLLSLPIIMRTGQILEIWLTNVPDYAAIFLKWTLVYTMVNSLSNPLWTAQLATGRIRRTILIGSNLFILAFPLCWLLLKFGASPQIVYPALCLGRLSFILTNFITLQGFMKISFSEYFAKVILPIAGVITLSAVAASFGNMMLPSESLTGLIAEAALCIVAALASIWFVGLTNYERTFFNNKIQNILNKCHS